MSEKCKWLHEILEELPFVRYPFKLDMLPKNGIYFFYEDGEFWGHNGKLLRIVRIGTHRSDNFRNRIAERFLLKENKMNFDKDKPKPSDRSIFRKNIGRALLNRDKDPYLKIWETDFLSKVNRIKYGHLRDIEKEKLVESKITEILRRKFFQIYNNRKGRGKNRCQRPRPISMRGILLSRHSIRILSLPRRC